jgi:MFS family permease
VVASAFAVLFMAYGAQYSFGVFFSAMIEEFGWSRASLSGAFSLYAFVYGACALAAGRLTDLCGPRVVIAAGGIFLGAGLAAMSAVRALWHPYVIYGAVAAIGMSTIYVPCSATVARWFVRRRGLAMGLALGGMGLGTLVMPPLAHVLVSRVGWRGAYLTFGVAVFCCLTLVAMFMRRDPESCGLHPDGDPAPPPSDPTTARPPAWTVERAVRTRAFWMIFAVFTATWIPVFSPFVHLVPMARGLGIAPLLAATLLSALGVAALGGRLAMGVASDRIGRRPALAIGLALQVAAFAALACSASLPALYAAAALFGFSYGSVSVIFPALVTDFFGRDQAGTLVGIVFAAAAAAAAWGPLATGFVFDRTGSYTLAWWLSSGFNALALGLLALTRPPGAPDARPLAPALPRQRAERSQGVGQHGHRRWGQ